MIIFILGAIIGSFLNVCIYRIPREESIAFPPSHCTNCSTRIKFYDLIPVLSYVFLKGRCRYCKDKISLIYPIIELTTGFIFYGLYINYGISYYFIKYAVLACFLIVIGMIDFNTTDVYFKVTICGIICGVIFAIIGGIKGYALLTYLYGALLGWGVIASIILIFKGMGWGDAEVCAIGGIFLGLKLSILMLFLSFIIGGSIGIILVILKKKTKKDYIAFGPYIAIAGIITMLFGNEIINWYFNTILKI